MSEGPNGPGAPRRGPQQHDVFAPSSANLSPTGPSTTEAPPTSQRRGLLTGAVVLSFVTAGFEVLGGVLWILSGTRVGEIEAALGTGGDTGGIVVMLGVVSLFVGAAYVCGGTLALRHRGSVLFAACCLGIVLNLAVLVLFRGVAGLPSLVLGCATLLLSTLSAGRR